MEKQFIVAVGVGISVSLMVACSATSERGPLSPTVLSPADRNDSRVEDLGPGPAPTPIPCEARDCTFSFSFTAASRDSFSGTCAVGFFEDCPLVGSGKFAGADLISSLMANDGTLVSSLSLTGNQLAVSLLLRLPALGNQVMWIAGPMEAQVQTHVDSGCPSVGLRRDVVFSGVIEHLGSTTGTYSKCIYPN
jgi:hypothetical protein